MEAFLYQIGPSFAAGIAILVYFWLCWSGRIRGWLYSERWAWIVLGPLPAMGLVCLGMGLAFIDDDSPIARFIIIISVAGMGVGMLIAMFEPSWWGPQWLHDLRAAGVDPHRDPYGEESDQAEWESEQVSFLLPGRAAKPTKAGARLMEHVSRGVEPMNQWPAKELTKPDGSGERGRLRRYDEGLAFVSNNRVDLGEDVASNYGMVMPFREIKKLDLVYKVIMRANKEDEPRQVEFEDPLLLIAVDDEDGWIFEVPRASSVAREVAELANCSVREIR